MDLTDRVKRYFVAGSFLVFGLGTYTSSMAQNKPSPEAYYEYLKERVAKDLINSTVNYPRAIKYHKIKKKLFGGGVYVKITEKDSMALMHANSDSVKYHQEKIEYYEEKIEKLNERASQILRLLIPSDDAQNLPETDREDDREDDVGSQPTRVPTKYAEVPKRKDIVKSYL